MDGRKGSSSIVRRVSAWAIPLLMAFAAACEPALDVRQVDNIERDYADLDGEFDTKCALAAYRGDVWLTWVERDPQTRQHRHIEDRKVVERATSGVKQTMQTPV